jgi:long-chain fatty acid transport protein
VGLTYRSKLIHEFRGTAGFSVPANALPLTATGAFRETGASAALTFPENAALAGFWQASERLALLATVRWTRWSRFTTLTTNFDNPALSGVVEPLDWRDTVRWAGGLDYRVSDRVTLHAGVAYENSSVPDATRSPLFPINATVNFSCGLTYAVNPSFVLVGSYTYQHVRSAPINLVEPRAGAIQGTIDRDFSGLGIQAVIRF